MSSMVGAPYVHAYLVKLIAPSLTSLAPSTAKQTGYPKGLHDASHSEVLLINRLFLSSPGGASFMFPGRTSETTHESSLAKRIDL
ncbi:hypothetical protein BaRGS_00022972 [Batillaria attramentaria]|uniref:Uncharacterized protein n=1 Tax=Batillaria attramentaria TaxID=370345 RepID=A0ABD0KF81_9CAEN